MIPSRLFSASRAVFEACGKPEQIHVGPYFLDEMVPQPNVFVSRPAVKVSPGARPAL